MKYMKRAIELAKKGRGYTSPNPVVGAVIVKGGRIIGEGYHERYGELHAERNALAACIEDPQGADMYVTLEPCCHYGKTPPCTEAIIEKKIGHVFVGSSDPNPLICGKGIRILRDAGVEVTENVMKDQCDALNTVFFHYIKEDRPHVTLKYAMTADGKIATAAGHSKWITGEAARTHVHRLRHENAAIMTGIGTVLSDNPMLNCRIEGGLDPVRIICDTNLRTPLDSQIVRTANDIRTVIATCSGDEACASRTDDKQGYIEKKLTEAGCEILKVGKKDGRADLSEVMSWLRKENIDSVLLEGGAELAYTALRENLVDRVMAYIAPKIFGGNTAKTPVGGEGIEAIRQAVDMEVKNISRLAEDVLIEYEVKKCLRE